MVNLFKILIVIFVYKIAVRKYISLIDNDVHWNGYE